MILYSTGPLLPIPIYGAAVVTDKTGAVILVGGVTLFGELLNTLHRLRHFNSDLVWTLMKQTLKFPRKFHAAVLIDDVLTKCTDDGVISDQLYFFLKSSLGLPDKSNNGSIMGITSNPCEYSGL